MHMKLHTYIHAIHYVNISTAHIHTSDDMQEFIRKVDTYIHTLNKKLHKHAHTHTNDEINDIKEYINELTHIKTYTCMDKKDLIPTHMHHIYVYIEQL